MHYMRNNKRVVDTLVYRSLFFFFYDRLGET